MNQKLIIVRGLPGSGKSTFAKWMASLDASLKHIEADMFFERTGTYEFDATLLPKAHEWCLITTHEWLKSKKSVIVSNTFTQRWEIQPYQDLAKTNNVDFTVITVNGNYGSVHNVPLESIRRMKARWQEWE